MGDEQANYYIVFSIKRSSLEKGLAEGWLIETENDGYRYMDENGDLHKANIVDDEYEAKLQ